MAFAAYQMGISLINCPGMDEEGKSGCSALDNVIAIALEACFVFVGNSVEALLLHLLLCFCMCFCLRVSVLAWVRECVWVCVCMRCVYCGFVDQMRVESYCLCLVHADLGWPKAFSPDFPRVGGAGFVIWIAGCVDVCTYSQCSPLGAGA